jgi:hypothetical protein
MTTLSFHHLAKLNSRITYIHTNPGIVKTGVMRYLPWYIRAVSHAGYAVLSPWRMEVEESGERHLEMGFAERYDCAGGVGKGRKEEKMRGISGQTGAYTLYNKGQAVDENEAVARMVSDGYDQKVWEHTLRIFDTVEKKGKTT